MNKFGTMVTMGILFCGVVFAQDKPGKKEEVVKVPREVQMILDKTEKKCLDARQVYEDKLLDNFKKCESDLLKEQQKFTKDGKLDEALLVKDRIAGFKKEISDKMNKVAEENWKENENKESRIVLWNQHSAQYNDRGSLMCNIYLSNNDKVVWNKNDIDMEWKRDTDCKTEIIYPTIKFNKIKIEITKWTGFGCGLSEVELYKNGKNILFGRPITINTSHPGFPLSKSDCEKALTDGITTSKNHGSGYWIVPENTKGVVEIDIK